MSAKSASETIATKREQLGERELDSVSAGETASICTGRIIGTGDVQEAVGGATGGVWKTTNFLTTDPA